MRQVAQALTIVPSTLVGSDGAGQPFNFFAITDVNQTADTVFKPVDPKTHGGTSWGGLAIEHRPSGSGSNGPGSGDYAFKISSMKDAVPSALLSTLGEIGCMYLVTRQDHGDCSAILADVGQQQGAGFSCQYEGSTFQVTAANAVTVKIRNQVGVVSDTDTVGFFAYNDNGTPANGVLIRSNASGRWQNAYTYIDDGVGQVLFNVDGSGNVTLTPAASATPAVNGQMTFQLTSNTQLTLKVKGSDGVVRSANLTLS